MSLALATLLFEWRRYMAAVVALALSGMMVLVILGLLTGIIHSDLATTERSRADIFVLPPKVASVVNGDPTLPARVEPQIYMNPHVVEVRSLESNFGAWVNRPAPGGKQVQKFVQITTIDPTPDAVTLPVDYSDAERIALIEPGAIAVDASNLAALGVKLGDRAIINGHTVHVRVILHGYGSVDNVNVTASRETARRLQRATSAANQGTDTGPLMVRLDDHGAAAQVRDQLNAAGHGAWRAWTKAEFDKANEDALLSQQVIGVLMVFLSLMSGLIGLGITSQTLRSAILSNIREFASLRALGISMGSLRLIVVELSFWAGVAGVLLAAALTWLTTLAAGAAGLSLTIRLQPALIVFALLMAIAVISGAMAMGVLKHSQPADLLR
jgi:putative ABC transport system permease protein